MRKTLLLLTSLMVLSACTDDRDIPAITGPTDPAYRLIHYWNFNDDATLLTPTHTEGGGALSYAGSAYDSVDEGTLLNARSNDSAGLALRLRNPSDDFTITVPTTGFKDVVLTFATMRTSNGPQEQNITYTTDGTTYTSAGLTSAQIGVSELFVVQQLDFTGIDATDNNPNFKIRIAYDVNADLDSGNSRYDNLTLEGKPVTDTGTGGGGTPPTEPSFEVFQYWNFNDTTSNATLITPTLGNGSILYSGATFDSTDESTVLNARNGDIAGFAYRPRNPSGDLIISLPTTGHKDILLTFATMRTGSGSQTQTISYTVNGQDYVTTGITSAYTVPTAFALTTIDFSAITAVNNNANFKVKISFDTASHTATSGNNRFDNLTVEGNTL